MKKTQAGQGGERCAIYCRVSSDSQNRRHTIESQRRLLPAYAARVGWRIIGQWADAGISGDRLSDLSGLQSAIQAIEAGLVDILLIIDIDRIARFRRESERALVLDICRDCGVDIATPEGRYDLGNRNDRLQFSIKADVSLYEKQTIRDRCQRGQREKREAGQWGGGTPPRPYRYDRQSRQLEIDPDQLESVRAILIGSRWLSARGLARKHPEYSARTIRRMTEPRRLLFYSGQFRSETGQNGAGQWPAIITESERLAILAAKRSRNARGGRSTAARHLLTGLGVLRCGYCGLSLKAWRDRKIRKSGRIYDKLYYRCVSIQKTIDPDCPGRMMPGNQLENRILSCLEGVISRPDVIREAMRVANAARGDTGAEVARLRAIIEDAELRRGRLVEAIEGGIISLERARERLAAIDQEEASARERIEELTAARPISWDTEAVGVLLSIDPRVTDFHSARAAITHYIYKIFVYQKNIYIDFNFPVNPDGSVRKRLKLQ